MRYSIKYLEINYISKLEMQSNLLTNLSIILVFYPHWLCDIFICLVCAHAFVLCFFLLFRATGVAYGSSQASGPIRTVAASLHHSNTGSGSLTHWARPGVEPASSWMLVRFVNRRGMTGTPESVFLMFDFWSLAIPTVPVSSARSLGTMW